MRIQTETSIKPDYKPGTLIELKGSLYTGDSQSPSLRLSDMTEPFNHQFCTDTDAQIPQNIYIPDTYVSFIENATMHPTSTNANDEKFIADTDLLIRYYASNTNKIYNLGPLVNYCNKYGPLFSRKNFKLSELMSSFIELSTITNWILNKDKSSVPLAATCQQTILSYKRDYPTATQSNELILWLILVDHIEGYSDYAEIHEYDVVGSKVVPAQIKEHPPNGKIYIEEQEPFAIYSFSDGINWLVEKKLESTPQNRRPIFSVTYQEGDEVHFSANNENPDDSSRWFEEKIIASITANLLSNPQFTFHRNKLHITLLSRENLAFYLFRLITLRHSRCSRKDCRRLYPTRKGKRFCNHSCNTKQRRFEDIDVAIIAKLESTIKNWKKRGHFKNNPNLYYDLLEYGRHSLRKGIKYENVLIELQKKNPEHQFNKNSRVKNT